MLALILILWCKDISLAIEKLILDDELSSTVSEKAQKFASAYNGVFAQNRPLGICQRWPNKMKILKKGF